MIKRVYKTIKKRIMSKYNEKQLRIAQEFRLKQKENLENYSKMRQRHIDAINEAGRNFDYNKTQLANELRDILNTRAELRRKGLSNFSEEIQNSFAEENAIHEKQRNNRNEFFESQRAHKKAIFELHEACCGTGAFLHNQELELLAQVERELEQEKTEQSKNEENE